MELPENIKTDSGFFLWWTGNPPPPIDILRNALKHTQRKDNLIRYATARRHIERKKKKALKKQCTN